MMGLLKKIALLIVVLPLLSSCIREEEVTNTPQGNFEALWKIIDEQYCFLEYKQIDWNAADIALSGQPAINGSDVLTALRPILL